MGIIFLQVGLQVCDLCSNKHRFEHLNRIRAVTELVLHVRCSVSFCPVP